MFTNPKDLVIALDSVKEGGSDTKAQTTQISKTGVALGSLILNLLPEGENKELAKQHLVQCIFFCKQSLRLRK